MMTTTMTMTMTTTMTMIREINGREGNTERQKHGNWSLEDGCGWHRKTRNLAFVWSKEVLGPPSMGLGGRGPYSALHRVHT